MESTSPDRNDPSPRPLLILTFEGLATSALGCYGSPWNTTPAIDSLAADGCVWDRWIAADDRPETLIREWIENPAWDLLRPTDSADMDRTELVTDDDRLIDQALDDRFDQITRVSDSETPEFPAQEIEETRLGQLIAAVLHRDSQGPWDLIWMHSRFLVECWDAPRDLFPIAPEDLPDEPDEEIDGFAEMNSIDPQFRADPPPIFDDVDPPRIQLDADCHPDLIMSWMRTYGCQVRLLDLMLKLLTQSMQVSTPQIIISSTGGMALGQNGWIGPQAGPLRSCDLRLPMLASGHGAIRSSRITSSAELPEIALHSRRRDQPLIPPDQWIKEDDDFEPRVVTRTARAIMAVTTNRWELVRGPQHADHLFLKPDDIDDANDVGRLRPDAIATLLRTSST